MKSEYKEIPASIRSNITPLSDDYFSLLFFLLAEISVCCSKIQVEAFIRDNELPTKILGRCPTCLYNFKRIFCDMMCSPNQSEFLNASQTVLAPNSNKEMVKVLDYHVSSEYANKVYKSCADVVMPSTSGTVMDILCGPWGGNYEIVINFFCNMGHPHP